MSISKSLKKHPVKDRSMTSITVQVPVDVVESMKEIAPKLGLAGYQTLLNFYLDEGLHRDKARFNLHGQERLAAVLKKHGVPQELDSRQMIDSKVMRRVLWIGSAFNALVALMLIFPSTLGALAALPSIDSIYYRLMLTFFVVLFSITYAWLALTPTISRPIVILSAVGKTGAFIIALVCLVRGKFFPKPSLFQLGTWRLSSTSFCGCIPQRCRRKMPKKYVVVRK